MTPPKSRSFPSYKAAIVVAVCITAVLLRVAALDSDAFPGLSWSSALLTDEGFYIHNARNVVLFGTAYTDQFNNMLIMPALHAVQVLVFRIWGVGAVQARMITVAASLATLPLFFVAVDRSLGRRTAATATLFLALDHVYVLYNRLALMDSPATSVLIVMLYLWVQGQLSAGWGRKALLYSCGLSVVLAYTIRGLAAPVCIALIAAIWLNSGNYRPPGANDQRGSRLRNVILEALPIMCGLLTGIAIYLALWYLPNRSEMMRVDHYYLQQLMPASLKRSAFNVIGAVFGNARGMAAFLIRHSSAVFLLAFAWIITSAGGLLSANTGVEDLKAMPRANETGQDERQDVSDAGRSVLALATVWLSVLWIVLAVTEYSPSRYYILAYPAMAIIGAHALWHISALVSAMVRKPVAAGFIVAVASYHIVLVVAERCFRFGSSAPITVASLAAVAAFCATTFLKSAVRTYGTTIQSRIPLATHAAIGVWAVINVGWTGLWLSHLTFRQREADRWLGEHLPANSVLVGAVAPGLCMNNHFRAVNVIAGLCNDRNPLEQLPGVPRYVLILDDGWREIWWDKRYPGLLRPDNRVKVFPHMLRSGFVIGVYRIPATFEAN